MSDSTKHIVLPTIFVAKPFMSPPGSAALTTRVLPEWNSEDPALRKLYSRNTQSRNHARFVERQQERQKTHEMMSTAKKSKTRVKGVWPPRATIKLNEQTSNALVGDSNRILYRVSNPLKHKLRNGSCVSPVTGNEPPANQNNVSPTTNNNTVCNMDSVESSLSGFLSGSKSTTYPNESMLSDANSPTREGGQGKEEISVRQLLKQKEKRELEHLRGLDRNNSIISRSSAELSLNEGGGRFMMDSDDRSVSQRQADSARDRNLAESYARLKWRRVPLAEPAVSTMLLEQQHLSPPRPQCQQQFQERFLDQQVQFEEKGKEHVEHYESYRAHASHNKSFSSSNNSMGDRSRDVQSYDSLNKTEHEIKKDTNQIYEILSGKTDMEKDESDNEGSVDSNLSSESSLNPLSISTSFSFAKLDGHPHMEVSIKGDDDFTLGTKSIKPGDVINNILSQRPASRPSTTHSRKSEIENVDDYYLPCSLNDCKNEACFWSGDEKRAYCADCWSKCPYHVTVGVKVSKLLKKNEEVVDFYQQQQAKDRNNQMQKEKDRTFDYSVRQRRTDTSVSLGGGHLHSTNQQQACEQSQQVSLNDELTSLSISLNSFNNNTEGLQPLASRPVSSNHRSSGRQTRESKKVPNNKSHLRPSSSNFGGRMVKLDPRYSGDAKAMTIADTTAAAILSHEEYTKHIFGREVDIVSQPLNDKRNNPTLKPSDSDAELYPLSFHKHLSKQEAEALLNKHQMQKYNPHMQNGRYFKNIKRGFGSQEYSKLIRDLEKECILSGYIDASNVVNNNSVSQYGKEGEETVLLTGGLIGVNASNSCSNQNSSYTLGMTFNHENNSASVPYYASSSISSNRIPFKLPEAKLMVKEEIKFDKNNNSIYDINSSTVTKHRMSGRGSKLLGDGMIENIEKDINHDSNGAVAMQDSYKRDTFPHHSVAVSHKTNLSGEGVHISNSNAYSNIHTVNDATLTKQNEKGENEVVNIEPTALGYKKTTVNIHLYRPTVIPSTPPSPKLPANLVKHPSFIHSSTSSNSQHQPQPQVQQQQHTQSTPPILNPQEERRKSQEGMVISGLAHDYSERQSPRPKRRSLIGIKGYSATSGGVSSSTSVSSKIQEQPMNQDEEQVRKEVIGGNQARAKTPHSSDAIALDDQPLNGFTMSELDSPLLYPNTNLSNNSTVGTPVTSEASDDRFSNLPKTTMLSVRENGSTHVPTQPASTSSSFQSPVKQQQKQIASTTQVSPYSPPCVLSPPLPHSSIANLGKKTSSFMPKMSGTFDGTFDGVVEGTMDGTFDQQ